MLSRVVSTCRSSEIVAAGANRMRGVEAGRGVGGSEGGGGGGLCDSGGDGGVESDHSRDRVSTLSMRLRRRVSMKGVRPNPSSSF